MPVFTRSRLHNPGLGGLADEPFAHDLDFQHQRLDITRQHNVAAATQNEFGRGFQGWIGQNGINIGVVLHADQRQGFGHNAKGIKRLERDVFLD